MSIHILEENRRTAVKAAIARASEQAQRQMTALDVEVVAALLDIYRRAARDISDDIAAAAVGATVRLEALQGLLGEVNTRLSLLEAARNGLLNQNLDTAARLGSGAFASVGVDVSRLANDAVDSLSRFVAADGLQLSDRIWRVDRGAREEITRAIESAVIQGHSASRAIEDFLGRGERVPAELAAKVAAAAPPGIARATGAALLRDEDGAYWKAERVFRTEINRAHGLAYSAGAQQTPGAIGLKFLLSPLHPKQDQCDMHASVNRYGLGPGVYPFGKSPWPAHPNTLSYQVVVFDDEVTQDDRDSQQDRLEWLKQQPVNAQVAALGSRAKRAALQAGILKENEIHTPWKVLRTRYARRGVDVDALAGSTGA